MHGQHHIKFPSISLQTVNPRRTDRRQSVSVPLSFHPPASPWLQGEKTEYKLSRLFMEQAWSQTKDNRIRIQDFRSQCGSWHEMQTAGYNGQ